MKLYKYRPLTTCEDFSRAQEILNGGKFWCTSFCNLNDPMEGVYSSNDFKSDQIKSLYKSKESFSICSFSEAFSDPILWAHYAGGFRGIVIETTVNRESIQPAVVKKINYVETILEIQKKVIDSKVQDGEEIDKVAISILTTKLAHWKHEKERRYLTREGSGYHEIGKITGLFTWSNDSVQNYADIVQSCSDLSDYQTYRDCLITIANNQKIRQYVVGMNNKGKIKRIKHDNLC
ncbi:MAG: hypothetical protein CEO22_546 [Candidatus Berkelbacteria bacterium Gr01-1014_85]|uniref:DUF2971 domain-containing protein n=1 Tax=Candidatus Berkelbacteria bacterium Gr01-1014_85 TaxID=2017150 RepID=A0A554JA93_9BACT|nr:MAG: hypothetical protein CEO22_546 [Candidatus Berkelbacteria bacterium Gr01-1014_85]